MYDIKSHKVEKMSFHLMIVEQEVGKPEWPDQVVLDVAKAEAEPLAESETRFGAGHLVK